jgi:hypothetical protein
MAGRGSQSAYKVRCVAARSRSSPSNWGPTKYQAPWELEGNQEAASHLAECEIRSGVEAIDPPDRVQTSLRTSMQLYTQVETMGMAACISARDGRDGAAYERPFYTPNSTVMAIVRGLAEFQMRSSNPAYVE